MGRNPIRRARQIHHPKMKGGCQMIFAISSKLNRGRRGLTAGRIAITEVAQEIRFDAGAGEERRIDAGVVEAGHRPAIEAQERAPR